MRTFFLLLAFFSSAYSIAQVTLWDGLRDKMKKEEKMKIENDSIDSNLDPEDSGVIVSEAMDTISNNFLDSLNATTQTEWTSDSVYKERLSQLPNIIGLPYNETVRRCIDLYVERRREQVESMLGIESYYFPMIEESLNKYGLPQELKYLAIVESALNPIALSRAGAFGLWQFISSTGRRYGLEINNLLDERRDPEKSTDAACRYLKYLYDMFGDWNLAIAAYNCGEGNVSRAIRRAGGEMDYWTIYPYLPRETRTYVPLFIAANYVMNYYSDHQLFPSESSLPSSTETVEVNQLMHFDQIADILQIDKGTLRALNPQYKRDVIPGNYRSRTLKLPTEQIPVFIEKENEIASYRADELLNSRAINGNVVVDHNGKIIHKVAHRETISSIANKYGVSAKSLRKWNGLKANSKLHVGRRLTLYIDNGGYLGDSSRTKKVVKATASSSNKSKSSTASNSIIATIRYKVQRGDSLYTIAQKFPGYTYTDLMELNKMTRPALKVGQYILVPKV
jgi:membrane-bound lytic murein transglycosylase D